MPLLLSDLARPAPIVLAPTGMVPTRAMTPHVPLTPAEIARDVAACAQIGISVVHLHARDEHGEPTWLRESYRAIVLEVRAAAPEVLINVSTSGRSWSDLERRADVLALDGDAKPDLASLTTSSLNFLRGPSVNAPDTVRALATIMRDRGIVPELELFDLGMINVAHMLRNEGVLTAPLVANLFFGNAAGMQPTLSEMGVAIDKLPAGTTWLGAGIGSFQATAQQLAISAGGGVRVGLEDGIHLDRARTTLATNLGLVERVHRMLELAERRAMTPAEYRRDVLGQGAPAGEQQDRA